MFPKRSPIGLLLLATSFLIPAAVHGAVQAGPDGVRYATTMGAVGVTQRVSEIMQAQAIADAAGLRPERNAEEKEHERAPRKGLPQNPGSPEVAGTPLRLPGMSAAGPDPTITSPQAIGTSFTGATLNGVNPTSSYPPDCMGAVGPTQFVVFVNGRLVTFNKATGVADGAINANPDVFFASVRGGSFTSDPRIRYDRLTGRWFLVIINVSIPNRILIAVSAAGSGTITGSTAFTFFYIPIASTPPAISTSCLADYPTLGLDANALYIGTNNFCSGATVYSGTDGYVIRKSSILGSGPIVVTAFRSLATSSGAGPYTPQGVDNFDPAATEGYFIGTDNLSYGLLQMRRISSPGGTPTISGNLSVTVPTTGAPLNVRHLGGTNGANGYLDALDDRLFAAHIRDGQLWTAHNIGINNTGVSSGTLTRDGSRWYHLSVPVGIGSPTLVESGTVYTASAGNTTDQRNYWIPSIMVSGQGHAAMGFCTAGSSEYANVGAVGRWSGDAAGTMQTPTLITSSSTAYNPPGDPGSSSYGRRWGDYSYVSLDPVDDMTMWSVGEFCNATNSYGVRATKLLAPPPATPSALADVVAGQSSVTLTLTGTAISGSGFYDPGADLPGVPAFNHVNVAVTNGTASGTPPSVTSVTYLTPTTLSLTLNAAAATPNVGGEHYTLTVTNPDGQTAAAAVVHVVVASTPVATLAAGPSGNEGDAGTTAFDFTVNLSSAPASPVTVRWQTLDGTATVADGDYVAAMDSITIATGTTSGVIHASVNGDTQYEPGETFDVTLTGATGATLGAGVTSTATIANDDAVPSVSVVASASLPEGDAGGSTLTFAVALTNPSSEAVTVDWVTADNSATTADGDYVPGSGTVTIPSGSTSGAIDVTVNGDLEFENNESFDVTLSAPANATLGTSASVGTIANDDDMPVMSIDAVSHLEGDGGTTLFRFTLGLSAASGVLASVDVATADGTATLLDNDYAAAAGPVTFAPGATSQTFDVLVNGDAAQEPDETFMVLLTNAVSATLATGSGTGTIANDDATPLLSIASASVAEGDAGTHALGFTVSLSAPSSQDVTVHWQTADGTAAAGTDYGAASGTLTIPALAPAGTVSVDVNGDVCGEADETFELSLSSPTNAAIANATATGTIANDDDATAPSAALASPNGGEVVEVATPVTILWSATDNLAVAEVDLLLSRDGGATYGETLAAAVPNSGSFDWTPTPPATTAAFVRVRARDANCNETADVSDAAFEIADHVTAVANAPVTDFELATVRPNPTRGAVSFAYGLPRAAHVRLSVVDVQGREVAVVWAGETGAGRHAATWSGQTPSGPAPRGLYFVRYAAGGKVLGRRFALLR